ncbi:MAG: ABC transporter permease [Deltaproteobacteria bacterium]|nr:ABC transporter permease [Deltaproteobacteria bacterium]
MFKNIILSRELIVQLFKRDFFAAYKKSFLGIFWIFIAPLIGILSWVFMNAAGVLNPGDVGIPYPAYVLLGSSIWGLFMGFYKAAAATLDVGSAFILQVKYPHEALLVKQVAQQLANFLISFVMTLIVLIAFGIVPSWKMLFFPFLIAPLFFLGSAIGLVISVANVISNEFQKCMDVLLGFCLYLTPVIYSSNIKSPFFQTILQWNPLTYLIGVPRDIIIYGRIEHADRFILAALFSFVLFLFSWRFFYIAEDRIIEKIL